MTYEEKVAWLRRYQQSLRQERELEQELLTLRSQACRVTPLLSAMPTGTPDGQGIPRAVERIIQAQQELERQIAICADTRRDIIAIINQITDARDQEILRISRQSKCCFFSRFEHFGAFLSRFKQISALFQAFWDHNPFTFRGHSVIII